LTPFYCKVAGFSLSYGVAVNQDLDPSRRTGSLREAR